MRFVDEILKVNAAWVDTKHGEEVQATVLLSRMKTMLKIANRLKERSPASATSTKPLQPSRLSPTLD